MRQKVLGLFSGIGMLEKGMQEAGFEIVASNEVDPIMCKTIKANFDHEPINRSVHELSFEDLRKDYGTIDGVVGGFPCVSYSKIANLHRTRVGSTLHVPTAQKIPRYSRYAELGGELFLHYFRLIAHIQPKFFVIENVPGLLSARIVRETFRNTPCNDKENTLGYYYTLHEGILNSKLFGLPQDRPRYFFVGARRNYSLDIEKPVGRRKLIVGDILEDNPDVEIPNYVKARMEGKYRDKPIITVAGEDAIAPTCVAHYSRDRGTRLVRVGDVVRPYTPLEYARLQGIPDDFHIEGSDSYRYLQVGNAVSLPVATAVGRAVKRMLT